MSETRPVIIPPPLLDLLRAARSVTVLTGAGISAESGIPTFRDSQTGLWAKYDPHELATPEAFQRNPELVLSWYRWRRDLVAQAQPNPGHLALAEMERCVPAFTLITQNVDGLHARAGSRNVLELHGSLQRLRCSNPACGYRAEAWPEEALPGSVPPPGGGPLLSNSALPHCPRCAALLRPDVVWFGEMLPVQVLRAAQQASTSCDLFFSIGTSGVVEPAASLPYEALRSGSAQVIEINPQPTPLNVYTKYYFPYPAGQVLPELVAAAWS